MAVPYHTHTFEIPTATKQDMAARAANDKAVTPSVLGTAATADISQFATAEQGKKADSAVQPQNLKNLAYKDKITVNEINTNGAPSNTTFLSGNGWQNLTGGGDMTVAIYDPQNKRTDAFNMANMKEADNAKVMTADERNRIANLDNTYLSKAGGTISGSLSITENLSAGRGIWSTGWFTYNDTGDPNSSGGGFQVYSTQKPDYFAQLAYAAGGGMRVYVNGYGDVATFHRDGSVRVGNFLSIGNAIYQGDGNITSSIWSGGHLAQHIENRCSAFADDRRNWCVTDSRIVNWVQLDAQMNNWVALPSGYVMVGVYQPSGAGGQLHFGGKQPQLYLANRGWFPLGGW